MKAINIIDAELYFVRDFIRTDQAHSYFTEILEKTDWQQQYFKRFGTVVPLPRLTAWYADADIEYEYSGISLPPREWTPALSEIKAKLEANYSVAFNSVLLNRYRNGKDSVSWHADDEPALGNQPTIASVSLGATRRFAMKHRRIKNEKLVLDLPSGSALLMAGATQTHWLHQIPKTTKCVGERISLTFRLIQNQLARP